MNVFQPVPRKIAVLRALQLGDLLCAVPALRALRLACPASRITLIGLPWAREFARRFSAYCDDFVEFPGFPGLPERDWDAHRFAGFLAGVQARGFDLALQMHGSGRLSNPIVELIGARRAGGYYRQGELCPDPASFIPWREDEHEIARWIRLVEALGAAPQGTELEFPLEPEDLHQWAAVAGPAHLSGRPYVLIHPGSQLPSRRWAPERFALVGDALARDGYAVVLTGTKGEAPLTAEVAARMEAPAIDLAGRTTLGALAVLMREARLLVSNDTGVSHIAAAMRTPSVIVSCGSDPLRWGPLDDTLHRVLHHPIACRPCAHVDCPIGHPCAEEVQVGTVIAEARLLLAATDPTRRNAAACAA